MAVPRGRQPVPLSEHEQRLLDQIERALYQEDPKFASAVRSTDLRSHTRRRLFRAITVLLLGFGLMFAGVVAQLAVLGIVGFGVMVGALVLAMTGLSRSGSQPALRLVGEAGTDARQRQRRPERPSRANKPPKSTGSLTERIEERWRRRWDERGR